MSEEAISSDSNSPKQYLQNNASDSIEQPSQSNDPSFDENFCVGLKYLEGKYGHPKDLKKAREMFQNLSASDGEWSVSAKYVAGWMLWCGFGGNMDERKGKKIMKVHGIEAKSYFEKFIEDDNLGFFSFFIGHVHYFGVEDYDKAMKYFQKSSQKSNSFAYNRLGDMYHFGQGVQKDISKGFQFYKKSAELGNCLGQLTLGLMYEHGTGIEQDYVMAAKYYQLSADQGYCSAQILLAGFYCNGVGVEIDKEKAAQLCKLAADQGYSDAQFIFAELCEDGDGIEKDLELAKQYYEKAAAQDKLQNLELQSIHK